MVGNILALRVFSLHFFGEITKRCCCYDSVSFFYNFERFRFNQVFFSLRGNTQYTVYALKTISEIQFSRFVVERGSLIYSIIITKETL